MRLFVEPCCDLLLFGVLLITCVRLYNYAYAVDVNKGCLGKTGSGNPFGNCASEVFPRFEMLEGKSLDLGHCKLDFSMFNQGTFGHPGTAALVRREYR